MPAKKNTDTSYGEKLLRLYIHLLNNGGKHYLSDLPNILDCSRANAYKLVRDIEKVLKNDLKTGKDGRKRWYSIRSYNYRNLEAITAEELNALHMCKDIAKELLPEENVNLVESTILNLSCMLKESDFTNRHNIQQQKVWFCSKGYIDYSKHTVTIDSLAKAICNKTYCYVTYTPIQSTEPKQYFYAPERIICSNNAYYVLGHKIHRDTNNIRPTNFAIHRVLEVTPTNQKFSYEFDEHNLGYFGLQWHEPKQFFIHFSAEAAPYIKERVWSSKQKITEHDDGSIILQIASTSEPELNSWVRSFGNEAKIISIES